MGDAPFCQSVECSRVNILKIDHPPEGGIFTYLQGYKYPYQGYPDERVVDLNASYKRSLISLPEMFSKTPFALVVPFFLILPKRWKIKAAHAIIRFFGNIYAAGFGKRQLEDTKFCKSARELIRVGKKFIELLPEGVLRENATKFLYSLVMSYEFDNAYRYRAQDLLGEFIKENLRKNPRREIMRVIRLGAFREATHATLPEDKMSYMTLDAKWCVLLRSANLLLMFNPFLAKFIRDVILEMNLEEVIFNEMDWYYVCGRFDYNFGGLSYKERAKFRAEEDKAFLATAPVAPEPKAQLVLVPNDEFFRAPREEAQRVVDGILKQVWTAYDTKNAKPV